LEDQEGKLGMALAVADAVADVAGEKKEAAQDGKDAVKLAKDGLDWFRGARKVARDKLDDGLTALTGDGDEAPVAPTLRLLWANLVTFFHSSAIGSSWLCMPWFRVVEQTFRAVASTFLHSGWPGLWTSRSDPPHYCLATSSVAFQQPSSHPRWASTRSQVCPRRGLCLGSSSSPSPGRWRQPCTSGARAAS